jgi:hypothetical protein
LVLEEKEVPFGRLEGKNILRQPWGNHPERIIGEVKDDNESSITYFVNKFKELEDKITTLKDRISKAENKGSFYMQLKHIKDHLLEHDGLGDYESLALDLQDEIESIEEIIKINREKNTEIKLALLQELNEAVQLISWQESTALVKDIRMKWIKTGQASENRQVELEGSFQKTTQDFFERRQAFYDDRLRLAKHYEKEYQNLVLKSEKVSELYGKEKADKITELKDAWKVNGAVPPEIYQPLFQAFQKNLRSRKNESDFPKMNLGEMVKQLEERDLDYKEAKRIQEQLKKYRTKNEDERSLKSQAFNLIYLTIEKNFLNQLARKKYKQFDNKDQKEQQPILRRLLIELIERDKSELEVITTNLEKFNTRDPKAQKMMNQKVTFQNQKIKIKEQLLSELNG